MQQRAIATKGQQDIDVLSVEHLSEVENFYPLGLELRLGSVLCLLGSVVAVTT